MTTTLHRPPIPPRRPALADVTIVALDPGDRRTGVAVSDPLGLMAHPRPAIERVGTALDDAVAGLVEREGASEVIVGVPPGLQGGDTAQTQAARAFARRLRATLSVPVTEWDERLSTREATRVLPSSGRRDRGRVDSAAAAVVLQAVLDARRRRSA